MVHGFSSKLFFFWWSNGMNDLKLWNSMVPVLVGVAYPYSYVSLLEDTPFSVWMAQPKKVGYVTVKQYLKKWWCVLKPSSLSKLQPNRNPARLAKRLQRYCHRQESYLPFQCHRSFCPFGLSLQESSQLASHIPGVQLQINQLQSVTVPQSAKNQHQEKACCNPVIAGSCSVMDCRLQCNDLGNC